MAMTLGISFENVLWCCQLFIVFYVGYSLASKLPAAQNILKMHYIVKQNNKQGSRASCKVLD